MEIKRGIAVSPGVAIGPALVVDTEGCRIPRRNIDRADANLCGVLANLGVSTVHEAYGRIGLMKTYMRPIWAGASIAGSAVTVLAQPGDNWMIHVAVEQCRKGDVVVVGCTADNSDGMFGELLATALKARGTSPSSPIA